MTDQTAPEFKLDTFVSVADDQHYCDVIHNGTPVETVGPCETEADANEMGMEALTVFATEIVMQKLGLS